MTIFRPVKLITFFILCIVTISCSENYDANQSKLLKSEFEKTYQYTFDNMPIDINQSYSIDKLRKINSATLISIAYRWHSHATDLCSDKEQLKSSRPKSSYDKLTNQQNYTNEPIHKTPDSSQKCHSFVFFDNWSEIQKMISFNLH